MSVLTVLKSFVRELVEFELSSLIRDRKTAVMNEVTPDLLVSANPGCSLHLEKVGHEVVHPMELDDRALRG